MVRWVQIGLCWALVVACSSSPASIDTALQPPDTSHEADDGLEPEPPEAPVVTLLPEQPTTEEPLQAVFDSAGTATIQWVRGGEVVDWTEASLPASYTAKGEVWQVRVRVIVDGLESPAGTADTIIGNSVPACPAARLAPASGTVNTEFRCECPERLDPDPDDSEVDTCRFWVEDEVVTTSCDLPGGMAVRGQSLRCERTPGDEQAQGTPVVSETLVISNAAPEGGLVSVQPGGATETSELTCVTQGGSDPDGDVIDWSVSWFVNETATPASTDKGTLKGEAFDKGDLVSCAATPSDGVDEGFTLQAAVPVLIQNTPPALSSAALEPNTATRMESLTCVALGWADPDPADLEEIQWAWRQNGKVLEQETEAMLSAASLQPGDVITCQATPSNGEVLGAPAQSSPALIINMAPVVQSVTLGPTDAGADSVLVCQPSVVTDPEGDAVTLSYAWTKNEQTLTSETSSTLVNSFLKEDVIVCRVTPTDPWDVGDAVNSNALTITNTAPSLSGVKLSPAAGSHCTDFFCEALGAEDPDPGETLVSIIRWERNGETVVGQVEASYQGELEPADTLQCFVSVEDLSEETSSEAASMMVSIANTAPSVTSAVVTPAEPLVGQALQCAAVGFLDAECDPPPVVSVEWLVNGAVVSGESQATLETDLLEGDTTVACRVTPSDGWLEGEAVTSSAVTLIQLPPSAPVVNLDATEGADGDVTCVISEPATGGDTVTYTVLWQVGSDAEKEGVSTLPAGVFSHCDRVRCRVQALVDGVSVMSNTSELILPNGDDCDDGNVCTQHNCHPEGGCAATNIPGDCDDEDACTKADVCQSGQCVGVSKSCDDTEPCTDDSCVTDLGCVHLPNTKACDADGSVCTVSDVCSGGVCVAGDALPCNDGEVCTEDGCDPLAGCITTPSSVSCDDGSPCTTEDTCVAGVCGGQPTLSQNACVLADAAPGYCAAGACQANQPPTPPVVSLEPSAPVTGQSVLCMADQAVDPDAWPEELIFVYQWQVGGEFISETSDTLSGDWVTKGTTLTCVVRASDGLALSSASAAVASVGDAPPIVSSVSMQSVLGAAASADSNLVCVYDVTDVDTPGALPATIQWVVNGETLPGPQLPHTAISHCDRVRCAVSVSDGVSTVEGASELLVLPVGSDCGTEPCFVNTCKPEGGCAWTAKTGACDDGDACTVGEECVGLDCVGTPLAEAECDDQNPCTTDACDSLIGCTHTSNTLPCDADGSVCTTDDVCANSECVAGSPLACDDGIQCTVDLCDPLEGCVGGASGAFDIEIGKIVSGNQYAGVSDEEATEIIQGPQGGIHIHISFQMTPPAEYYWTPLKTYVEMELRTPCCDGEVVASFFDPVHLAWKMEDGIYLAGNIPLVFYLNEAYHYEDQTGCVRLQLGIYDQEPGAPPVVESAAQHVFLLVDED